MLQVEAVFEKENVEVKEESTWSSKFSYIPFLTLVLRHLIYLPYLS